MAFKSKFIISTLLLSLVSSPLASASPFDLSPSARPIPSVCDLSNPSKPKGCTTKDLGELLRKQIETYIAFAPYEENNEYEMCIASQYKLLWKQWFGPYESSEYRLDRWSSETEDSVDFLAKMASAQLVWVKEVESNFKTIDHDRVKSCLEFWVYRLNYDYGPIPEASYKKRFNAEYHDIFAKYLVASNENVKTNGSNQRNLYNSFLQEIFAVYDTVGKRRISDHFKLIAKIKSVAETALLSGSQESKRIAEKNNALAQAQALADAKAAAAKKVATDQANARARAKVLASGGCINKVTGGAIANGQRSFGNTCVNGRLIADKPAASTSQSGSCQDPTSGMLVKNGASIKYSDGTRTCVNGRWSNPTKSGGSSGGKTLVSKTCTISTTGLTSDWYGAQYSWTIWNNWSDGSRSVASMGSGYSNQVPSGC